MPKADEARAPNEPRGGRKPGNAASRTGLRDESGRKPPGHPLSGREFPEFFTPRLPKTGFPGGMGTGATRAARVGSALSACPRYRQLTRIADTAEPCPPCDSTPGFGGSRERRTGNRPAQPDTQGHQGRNPKSGSPRRFPCNRGNAGRVRRSGSIPIGE